MRIFFLLLIAALAHAQDFDVASIKPYAPGPSSTAGRATFIGGHQGGPGTADPSRMTYNGVSLVNLIAEAWDVKTDEISGPDWLSSARFDVAATLPIATTKEQSRVMLQNLLAHRFGMMTHRETKEISVYVLSPGKNGPKMKLSDLRAERRPTGFTVSTSKMTFTLSQVDMSMLANTLRSQTHQVIVDKTGLTGKYDIVLTFAPENSVATPGEESAPSLFTAVQEQLGLKLDAAKSPVAFLVIDHLDKTPTEN